jgi:hypothetical protein
MKRKNTQKKGEKMQIWMNQKKREESWNEAE